MAELGSGSGTDYPSALDTDDTLEVNDSTLARADVPNDIGAAIVAIENELGTNPAGSKADVKTFLQTEHNVNGTHDNTKVVMIAGTQTLSGSKRFSETVLLTKGTDVASATTVTLGAGNYFDITGTTTIAAIAAKGIGATVKLHFDGACTITHHATNLVLPGSVDWVTAAGDELEFTEYATGDWRMTGWTRYGSNSAAGSTIIAAAAKERSTTSNSYVQLSPVFRMGGDGTVTAAFDLKQSGGGTATARWYKNGVAAGSGQVTASASYVEKSDNLAVSAGDYLQIWALASAGDTAHIQNCEIRASKWRWVVSVEEDAGTY